MIDVDQRLNALIGSARSDLRAVSDTTLHPRPAVEGRDGSGAVLVVWRGEDPRLEFVAGWEQRIAAEDLPGAVTEAFTAALTARYADDVPRLGDEPSETARAMGTPDLSLLAGDSAFAAAIRRPEFPQRLDALLREIERRAALRRTGGLTGGAVTVRLGHDGHPAAFLVDADDARGRTGAELTRDAEGAIAEARRRFDGGDPASSELGPQDMIEVLSA